MNTHSSGTFLYAGQKPKPHRQVRQDPGEIRASDKTSCKGRIAPVRAMTAYRANDTSVIRGPAMKKAGRLDSYGAAQQAAALMISLPSGGVAE